MSPAPSMAASVGAASLPVGQFLEDQRPFRVPRYQRAYAWGQDETDDLCADLEAVLAAPGAAGYHFFGAVVTVRVPDSSSSLGHFQEIVDGQQRLTTFCLLLSAIEDAAREQSAQAKAAGDRAAKSLGVLAEETANRFLYYDDYKVAQGTTSRELRLRVSDVDTDQFESLVRTGATTGDRDSHKRLAAARKALVDRLVAPALAPLAYKDRLKDLRALRDALLARAFLIHVSSTERHAGYRLFSVLNDRGEQLSVADLLRNHTLEQLHRFPTAQRRAAKAWDDVAGGERVDDFLRAYYPSLKGVRASRDKLFENLRDLLFSVPAKNTADADAIAAKVEELAAEQSAYALIDAGQWPYPPAQNSPGVWHKQRLQRLVLTLRHELAHPLLLAAARTADEKSFAELVHKLELFAFRYKNVCNGHATPPSRAYYDAAAAARASAALGQAPDWQPLYSALRGLLASRADSPAFRSNLAALRYSAGADSQLLRELLTTLEDYGPSLRKKGKKRKLTPDDSLVIDVSAATLEHIHPQNPKIPDPDLDPLRHEIGNLSFWPPGENSSAGNKSFAAKQAAYAASRVSLNHDLAVLQSWDLQALEDRREILLGWADEVFTV